MTAKPDRLEREKRTISLMISMYCRGVHKPAGELCSRCAELGEYALLRLDQCSFGMHKPACADCAIHCYKPVMRERVREVMRYAGPRMLLRHPYLALMHLLDSRVRRS